jgi:hypothetical protein
MVVMSALLGKQPALPAEVAAALNISIETNNGGFARLVSIQEQSVINWTTT